MHCVHCRILALCGALALAPAPAGAEPDTAEHAHEHRHEIHRDTEEIIVTASPLEHNRDELALSVDALDRQEILLDLGTTLGNTLDRRPGISSTGFSGGASRPVIRGQDAFRTEVLEGGLSTQDVSQLSPDHAVPINPLAVQRIEVVRGPAALRYGGGATAGVVNALTNRVPVRQEERLAKGELFGAYNTVDDERSGAFALDGGHASFGWHLDGLWQKTDDYKIGGSSPNNQNGTDVDARSISAGLSHFGDPGRVGFAYAYFENDYGIPEDEDVEIDLETHRYRFEGDLEKPLPGLREVRLRSVYTDYKHDEIAGGATGQTFNNDQFDGRVELLHDGILGFVGAVGVQGRYRDFKAGGEAAEFLAPVDTSMAALYLFEERELGAGFTTELGFRLEGTRVEGKSEAAGNRDRDFLPVSGAVGILYEPFEDWRIGLTGAVSQRAPSDVELFAMGPHEATGTFELGDADLDEETSFTGDVRVAGPLGPVSLEASAFITRYNDYVFGELTGNTVDEDGNPVAPGDPDALDELFYRDRDAVFYGGEVSAEAELWDALGGAFGLDGQFDWVRARFKSGSEKDVPRVPPVRWGVGGFFRSEQLFARVGLFRAEKQNRVGANERKTDSYNSLDATLVWLPPFVPERFPIEVSVVARNLTDERARNAVSFNKDEVRLPGRSVRFGVHGRF